MNTIIFRSYWSEMFDRTEPRWADLVVAADEVVRA